MEKRPSNPISQLLLLCCICLTYATVSAQGLEPFDMTEEWLAKIEELAPVGPRVSKAEKKKILVFSKATGFYHWTIPHNAAMLRILGKKSGAFEIHVGYDILNFERASLAEYDAVVMNNANPAGPKRDLFWDLLAQNTSLSESEIEEQAPIYERNLLDYVEQGGGLMILHGAITLQNNSEEVSRMTGGSFDYHPKQQEIHVKEVDPDHPMVRAFKGDGFTHVDEPYFFKNAYSDYNFRPLLYMETGALEGLREEAEHAIVYLSWIKRHGEGRVFYTSPSHNAQTLENKEFLQFLLDGLHYVVGDLEVDDSPIGTPPK